MAVFRTVIRSDLQKPLVVQQLSGNMFTADNASNEIAVEVTNGGEPVALSGAVTAYAVRADGVTAMFSGTISGNVASVVLPASCYVEVGTLSIVIKVGTTTVGACTCYVYRTTTDEIVDPGHVIPSIDELLEQIEACRTATANANTAATNANTAASNANTKAALADEKATLADQKATLANTAAQNADTKASLADTAATNANTKAGLANDAATLANTKAALADEKANLADAKATLADTAATNANTKAGLADTAAQNADEKATLANNAATLANTKAGLADTAATNANTAAGKIDNMTVAATGLPEGSAPIATISEVDGHKHIAFQIPKGDKGKDFHIAFTFASIAAMEAYSGDIELFDYAMIDTGNVQDADTGKLYCYEQDEEWHYIGDLSGAQGIKGETGTGIDHVTLNNDYTLTIYYDNGTQTTTTSIRGATGITPNIAIGNVVTLLPNQQAYVTRDPSSTAENPVFNFGIPKGDTGSAENVYGTTVPMSESDSTSVYNAIGSKLDKNQGIANVGKFMKVGANGELTPENVPDPTNKADKVTNATTGNFAGLDATGNLTDSGKSAEDFAGAIYKTATPGSIITIDDGADNLPVKELKVGIEPVQDLHGYDHPWPAGGGKNLLPYPYKETTKTVNGITFTDNGNGTISVNGTATGNAVFILANNETWKTQPAGNYVLSGCPSGGGQNTYRIHAQLSSGSDFPSGMNDFGSTSGASFANEVTLQSGYNIYIFIGTGTTLNNAMFKPMIEAGSTATAWSPYSNICPISGWTGAKVTRTGKNLLPLKTMEATNRGLTIKTNASDGSYTISGTSTNANDAHNISDYISLNPGTYTFSMTAKNLTVENGIAYLLSMRTFDGTLHWTSNMISFGAGNYSNETRRVTITFTKKTTIFFTMSADARTVVSGTIANIQLELGNAVTSFEPCKNQTYDITFPSEAGTVYGGTLDVVSGKLVVNHANVDLSTLSWTDTSIEKYDRAYSTGIANLIKKQTSATEVASAWCEQYEVKARVYVTAAGSGIAVETNGTLFVQGSKNPEGKFVYELATPVTYQLTPQEIRTLLGVNNIWADTGDVTELIYPVNTDTAMALYEKADKVANATAGNFAALDAEGNLKDSGKKPSDFLTEHQDISGKLDKDQGSTNSGKFMKVGSDGKLVPDTVPDPTGKADKVSGATNGNFAGLDANGNLTDSGKSADDFLDKNYEINIAFNPKTWNGFNNIYSASRIWTDGENIYYSAGSDQYVLDKSTSTWNATAWNGKPYIYGDSIWTDGENVYYSNDSDQYVLDKSTSTWNNKTWNGLTRFYESYIWTDGENIYYSNKTDQYVLDKSTSTWNAKTWNGLTYYYGNNVWTDGENIYYNDYDVKYVLDKSTSTWSQKTWSGLTDFYGRKIWTDGENVYYSDRSEQYVLDKSTSVWSVKTWNGTAPADSDDIWTDGENIYYSHNSNNYILSDEPKVFLGQDGEFAPVPVKKFIDENVAPDLPGKADKVTGATNGNLAGLDANGNLTDSGIAAEDVNSTQDGIAIVAVGDTHDAISSGQFVFVRSHPTLAKGMYKATAAIAANGALSTSNLTADDSGGLNDLQSQITSLNSNLTLLWESTATTLVPTTINLDLSKYDAILVVHTGSQSPQFIPKGRANRLMNYAGIGYQNDAYIGSRLVTVNENNVVIAEGGYTYIKDGGSAHGSAGTAGNSQCTPQKIYGVKNCLNFINL